MAEIVVIKANTTAELQAFSQYLWQQKMTHRILDQGDSVLLLVGSNEDASQVATAYKLFLDDADLPNLKPKKRRAAAPREAVRGVPVTLVFGLLSILGYLLVHFDGDYEWVRLLTFTDFAQRGSAMVFGPAPGQPWRLLTPIFLHFSVLHLVFNTLWLWDLGRRVEHLHGSTRTLCLVVLMGLGSNIAQYLFAGNGIFGGMSGVIYGLLGYGWVWSVIQPQRSLQIPRAVIAFMLIWLVLCLFGFATLLGAGSVANAAHVGGLIMGMLLGLGAALIAGKKG
jgi:GlpG protein